MSVWKIIASLFKAIISGLGKIIMSVWKIVLSLFSKGGTVASAIKAPLITKAIATTATGVAMTVGSGSTQAVETVIPAITKTSTSIAEDAVQTTRTIAPSSGKIIREITNVEKNLIKDAVQTTRTIAPSSGKTIRRITNVEKNLIKNAKHTNVFGKSVAKRNSTFDPKAKDALGRTNMDRMKQGLAPIGKDGKSIELHHLKQQNNGKIVELTSTEHKVHSKVLHRYTKNSEIDRKEFEKWKRKYWKQRAKDFE